VFDLATTGSVTMQNLVFDGNREDQSVKGTEVKLTGAARFRLANVTVLNNNGWAMIPIECGVVQAVNYECLTNGDHGDPAYRGLDGFHTVDCSRVLFANPRIDTGDDCIAVHASDRDRISQVAVSGGTLRSSDGDSGCGVKVFVHGGADSRTVLENVHLDTAFGPCNDQFVAIQDESDDHGLARNVTVDATATSRAGRYGGGILLRMPTTRADIGGTIKAHKIGVEARDSSDLSISGAIDAGSRGLDLRQCDTVLVESTIANANAGIRAVDTEDLRLSGAIHDCSTAVTSSGDSGGWLIDGVLFANNGTDLDLTGDNTVGTTRSRSADS
jgi:polygalacturonase